MIAVTSSECVSQLFFPTPKAIYGVLTLKFKHHVYVRPVQNLQTPNAGNFLGNENVCSACLSDFSKLIVLRLIKYWCRDKQKNHDLST